ncbi:MAG: hypothetical protein HYY84_08095 [Deltaproteobacteria bacterium]|nr:hypothetical protein [Deltaproteobacteria bacterium]
MNRISPHGRWNGKLTSRDLPVVDETIDALSKTERTELARHWLSRGASERRVGDAFLFVRDALRAGRAPESLVTLATRAVDDEMRHAEISRIVASRFAGRELPAPALLPLITPKHPGVNPEMRLTLWMLGQCAFNETYASAVLEASLAETTGPLANAALRELLSDEVDHAKLGWAFFATQSRAEQKAVEPWLLPLARVNLKMWRETPRDYPSDAKLVRQGALSLELLETALIEALKSLVVPGFREFGIDTSAIERWISTGAPTQDNERTSEAMQTPT